MPPPHPKTLAWLRWACVSIIASVSGALLVPVSTGLALALGAVGFVALAAFFFEAFVRPSLDE